MKTRTTLYTLALWASLALLSYSIVPSHAGFWDDDDDEDYMNLPDLVVSGSNISPLFTYEHFNPTDCVVGDGCIVPGDRRLLRFSTMIVNKGNADIVLGNPAQSDFFTWSSCHGHFHRKDAVTAVLLDDNDDEVTSTTKIGFCLLDSWNVLGTHQGKYNCQNQGLTVGWGDIYGRQLDCQWVDITGIPAGNYTLRITANANRAFTESNYDNNSVDVPVAIP